MFLCVFIFFASHWSLVVDFVFYRAGISFAIGAIGTGLLYCVERFGWVYLGTRMDGLVCFESCFDFGLPPFLIYKKHLERALDSRF